MNDRLPGKDVTWIDEFMEAGERCLALEQMADVLSADGQPLAPDEREEMLWLVVRMRMGPRIPGALRFALFSEVCQRRPAPTPERQSHSPREWPPPRTGEVRPLQR